MKKSEFYSNGKLLISGEYAVLDGAKAWAMPTKFGQYLKVSKTTTDFLSWKSLDEKRNSWFNGTYTKDSLTEISCSDTGTSRTLLKILREAQKLNPDFLNNATGFEIETKLTFPRDWGLGSSSTLLNNIAQWAKVDAYKLVWNAFSGSGYDIACAQNDTPIIYQLEKGTPLVRVLETKPPFSNSLYFVYLNKKRNSREAIAAYRQQKIDKTVLISKINELTEQMTHCTELGKFERLVNEHENVLSEALGIPTVREELFPEYQGSIKSLGAWGGDFILVTGNSAAVTYFEDKGFTTVLPFQEMIL